MELPRKQSWPKVQERRRKHLQSISSSCFLQIKSITSMIIVTLTSGVSRPLSIMKFMSRHCKGSLKKSINFLPATEESQLLSMLDLNFCYCMLLNSLFILSISVLESVQSQALLLSWLCTEQVMLLVGFIMIFQRS